MPLPVPDACQFDADTLRVADFDTGLFPESGGVGLALLYAYDGYNYVCLDTFFDNDGRDISFTPTGAFTLRYARVDTDEWGVLADVDPDSAGTGYHYEYEFTGDVSPGPDPNPQLFNYRALNTTYADFSAPDYSKSVTVTVVANRVRDSDSAVVCTDTDTISGLIGPYEEWGDPSDTILSCDDGATALSVTLAPASGCPGDTITATGNYTITGATLSGDALTLSPTSGTVVSFVLPESITEAGDVSIVFTTDAAIDTPTATKTLTIGEECFETPPPCTPPAPVACFDGLTTLQLDAVAAADFPDCATTLKFQTQTGAGSWTDRQTGIMADTPYSIALDIAPSMKGRFVSDDGTAGAEIDLGICECETVVLPPDEANIPAVPDAPTLAKSCADATVTITSPAFSTAEGAHTASIEIRRRLLQGGDWATVHTFEAEGDWDDDGVAALGEYEYSARACNAAGCSDGSSAASIALISDTLALAFQSPAEDSELTGRVLVRFTAVDAGGASDLEVFVNNALAAAPTRKSGTALNGIYTFTLDTRRAAQGAATIAIRGTGSDGCKKQIALAVTFANTRALGVLYRDFLTETAATGLQIKRLPLSIALGELDSDPSRRYWGQVGVTDDIDIEPVTSETDPADAQAAFDAMQSFPMQLQKSWPQLGANPPGSILYGIQTLNAPAPQILIRIRQEQAEQFLAYDTESAAIPKIRPISAGKFLVFAQNPDKVFVFENDALTLLADIETDEVLSNVTDAAVLGDKVYFLDSGKLYVRDNDGGAARTFQIALHSETRVPTFIEACGAKLIVLLVGATGQKTLAVAIENNQISDVWTLADAATLAWSGGDNLYIACGAKLYISASGTTAPVLVETFDADVTAIAADGATAAIGLEDGSLQVLRQGVWSEAVTPGGANISATTVALLDFEYQSALWGKSATATLFGQDSAGAYDVTRALGTFTGVATQPTGIASLARYFVEGEDDAPDDERVLIGTTGGVLLALSVARQSNASAWLHSSISDWESGAVARLIPVEA